MAKPGFCVVSLLDKCEFLGRFDRATLSWENKPTRGEEGNMQTPATEIDQMIVQLNEFILPSQAPGYLHAVPNAVGIVDETGREVRAERIHTKRAS